VIHVTLVGSQDRQIEEMLRIAGIDAVRATADAAASNPADVVVFDVRGQDGLPSVVTAIKRQHPDVSVVIVASKLEPALLLDAMRAGVSEVVAEPIDHEELARVVQRVAGNRVHTEPGRVYGFIGAKGGVGTTTIAVNVATSLGSVIKPERALMIELQNAAGDATLFTGAEPRFSIVDALENTHRLDQVFFRNLVTQIAASTDLLASPDRAPASGLDVQRIKQVIAFASTVYKHTVIDLARSDRSILEALDQLNSIYLVANQELATVKSASRMAAMLRDRYGRDKIALVLSRSDRDADISQSDVEKAAGCSVVHTFPSNYRVALQALNKGRPVALDNHNDLSASFRRFAHHLAGVRPARESGKSSGLFGRLTHSRS
jgi:pilus assembly protein CpaE